MPTTVDVAATDPRSLRTHARIPMTAVAALAEGGGAGGAPGAVLVGAGSIERRAMRAASGTSAFEASPE
jgi:hypothetical protein